MSPCASSADAPSRLRSRTTTYSQLVWCGRRHCDDKLMIVQAGTVKIRFSAELTAVQPLDLEAWFHATQKLETELERMQIFAAAVVHIRQQAILLVSWCNRIYFDKPPDNITHPDFAEDWIGDRMKWRSARDGLVRSLTGNDSLLLYHRQGSFHLLGQNDAVFSRPLPFLSSVHVQRKGAQVYGPKPCQRAAGVLFLLGSQCETIRDVGLSNPSVVAIALGILVEKDPGNLTANVLQDMVRFHSRHRSRVRDVRAPTDSQSKRKLRSNENIDALHVPPTETS